MDGFNRKFGSHVKVVRAENRFLGKSITVAGLLSGKDVLGTLQGKNLGNFVIIPQDALSATDGILLDDLALQDLSNSLGRPVYGSGRTVRDFFNLLFKLAKK